jgi:competence protein ComEA
VEIEPRSLEVTFYPFILSRIMGRLRLWIRNSFGFSGTETNAFLIMLPLMVMMIFVPPIYRRWLAADSKWPESEHRYLDSQVARWTWPKKEVNSKIPARFPFNPNMASMETFQQLGFPEKLSARIIKYRLKGGHFKIRADLLKIFGMDSALYRSLFTYINLPVEKKPSLAFPTYTPPAHPVVPPFDLNEADSLQLLAIRGIGPARAHRILSYRKRLGGFTSSTQLREVYGMDSSSLAELVIKSVISRDFKPRLININRAGKKELVTLPYINYALANLIIAYRFQHGGFKSIDEFGKLALVDSVLFKKIKPYLSLRDSL